MNRLYRQSAFLALSTTVAAVFVPSQQTALAEGDETQALQKQEQRDWTEVFSDPCTGNWQPNWFLDGDDAKVSTGEDGMTIDATGGYAVLWTKEDFEGDVRIDYDWKRLDSQNRGVNIIYIQAVGDEEDGHDQDITKWSDERADAAMSHYFNNMHTYHISYAAYSWRDPGGKDYVRGRRYLPLAGQGLKGTELAGEYEDTGLFDEPGQWIRVTVIKTPRQLLVRFVHPEKTLVCQLKNEDKPPIDAGRIGLRLMPGRKSLIKDFRVSSNAQNRTTN